MFTARKPRIGFLGIMHGLYDESQPEITRNQEAFAGELIGSLKASADFDFPGAAKSREDIERIMGGFNAAGYDGILVVMLLYSPGLRLVKALEDNRLPLMLANIQPLPAVTEDWNWSRLTTNQGIHGMQDTANMVLQAGITPTVITEDWKSEDFRSFFDDWAKSVMASHELKKSRIAVFGRMKGMGDIVGDEGNYQRVIGPESFHEGIGQVYRHFENISEADVDEQVARDRRNFQVSADLPPESHRYAVRLQLSLEAFMVEANYDGFTANFDDFREDGRFEQIPMLGASNLMAAGYAYANEGDVHTAALVGAGHLLTGAGHFTEMYSLDFQKDSALMSHMGEGNWKLARRDRPIRLIDRPLEIGGLSNPPTLVFSAEPGSATLVSLVSRAGTGYRLIVCPGTVLDTEVLAGVPMPYFHFRPDSGIRKAMDQWLFAGGTHHQVLTLGNGTRKWTMWATVLGIDCVVV